VDLTAGEIVGTAPGTELYLLRFANGGNAVWVEQPKGGYRQKKLTVKPPPLPPSGGDAGNVGDNGS
jgi:hypothetical protein